MTIQSIVNCEGHIWGKRSLYPSQAKDQFTDHDTCPFTLTRVLEREINEAESRPEKTPNTSFWSETAHTNCAPDTVTADHSNKLVMRIGTYQHHIPVTDYTDALGHKAVVSHCS